MAFSFKNQSSKSLDMRQQKLLRFFMRLGYPQEVRFDGFDFHGVFPDLPGTSVSGESLSNVYTQLENLRHEWIKDQIADGKPIHMPNRYCKMP